MSRYVILVFLNTPFVLAGLVNALVSYKLRRVPRRKFVLQVALWVFVFLSLVLAEPIYNFLFSNNLTRTEPLSLFDVIQITGIVLIFFIVNRHRTKIDSLERRAQDLHRELSIRLSQDEGTLNKT